MGLVSVEKGRSRAISPLHHERTCEQAAPCKNPELRRPASRTAGNRGRVVTPSLWCSAPSADQTLQKLALESRRLLRCTEHGGYQGPSVPLGTCSLQSLRVILIWLLLETKGAACPGPCHGPMGLGGTGPSGQGSALSRRVSSLPRWTRSHYASFMRRYFKPQGGRLL